MILILLGVCPISTHNDYKKYLVNGFLNKVSLYGCFDLFVTTGEAIALGFQHYILALGTAVMIPTFLVPLMGGTDVRNYSQNLLLVS